MRAGDGLSRMLMRRTASSLRMNEGTIPMPAWFATDRAIRLTGLLLLAAGIASLALLCRLCPPLAAFAPEERGGLAAFGFLGCTLGTAALTLGAHLHDHVPVARPWVANKQRVG